VFEIKAPLRQSPWGALGRGDVVLRLRTAIFALLRKQVARSADRFTPTRGRDKLTWMISEITKGSATRCLQVGPSEKMPAQVKTSAYLDGRNGTTCGMALGVRPGLSRDILGANGVAD